MTIKRNIVLLAFCIYAVSGYSQSPYTYTKDGNEVVVNGIVTKYLFQNDSSFNWYRSSYSGYTADVETVQAMERTKGTVRYIVFGGTWCSDSQFIIPKFFKLQEQSGVSDNTISMFAMDRSKKTIGNVGDAFKITNVPTIIVMRDGKELGRIVEYGSSGKWDKELAAILKL